jgi:hypothetical protein
MQRGSEKIAPIFCTFFLLTPRKKYAIIGGASMFRASAEFPVYHRLRQFVKQNLVKKLHKKSPVIKVIFVLDKQKYFWYNVFTRLRKAFVFKKENQKSA